LREILPYDRVCCELSKLCEDYGIDCQIAVVIVIREFLAKFAANCFCCLPLHKNAALTIGRAGVDGLVRSSTGDTPNVQHSMAGGVVQPVYVIAETEG